MSGTRQFAPVTTVVNSSLVGVFVTRWRYSRPTLILWNVATIAVVWAVALIGLVQILGHPAQGPHAYRRA
jgi:hypothetical protein